MEGDHCYCWGKPDGMAKEKKNRSKLGNPRCTLSSEKLKDGFGCRNCIDKLKQYANKVATNVSNAIPVLPKVPAADLESTTSLLPTATINVRRPSQQIVRIRSVTASPPV
jgi:hypothetical protein